MHTTRLITRRRALVSGAAALGGLVVARSSPALPPTYGHLLRMGDDLTYAAHRALVPDGALVREYTEADITSFPAIGVTDPGSKDTPRGAAYRELQRDAFAGWRLAVEGQVARPRSFSLAELRQLRSRTQITRHSCEEGWSAIGKWTGVPLGTLLDAVGLLPDARFVLFESFDDYHDSIDLLDALHPQTILAYGMNGRDLPVPHGGPLRLRVERQIGYKHIKFVHRIRVLSEFDDGGALGNIQNGWSWYTGI